MTALTGQNVASTYKDLLQLSNSGAGLTATLLPIYDGGGTVTGVKLSTTSLAAASIVLPFKTVAIANGANNDIPITGSYVRLTGPTGVANITGFSYLSGTQPDGMLLYIMQTTAQTVTITHQATSAAANQITCPFGSDVAMGTTRIGTATFIYDLTTTKWVYLGTS
jgi:hypothetical protein